MASLRIKKNDQVVVLSGKDKGKIGQVLEIVHPSVTAKNQTPKVVVKGVNMIKKHQKPTQTNQEGGIVTREAPIWISKVAYVASKSKEKATGSRIGFVFESGRKVRFVKKSKKVIKG